MNRRKQWQIYYGNNKNPCFVTHSKTVELLYCNDQFLQLFDLKKEVIGQCFDDVVALLDSHVEQALPDWEKDDFYETESYNKGLNMRFHMRATIDRSDSTVFTELIPIENDLRENLQFEKAMSRCMEIYAKPSETVLSSFMELLCDFYKSSRAYVYRFNFDDNTINCVAQWSIDPEFRAINEIGAKMDASFLMDWIATENEAGIVRADSETESIDPDSTRGKILQTFRLKNVIVSTVEDANQKIIGFVGLSNRENPTAFFDRRLVTIISRFVAQDVSKGVIDEALFKLHFRDTLTGLYNRNGYAQRIEQILAENPKTMGVISVNINGLKYINENMGIKGGDEHIKKSSKLLEEFFDFEIFRMSGDEFIGIAPDVDCDVFEGQVAELHSKMRKENNFDFSMGHSCVKGNIALAKLMLEADTVMYINKQEYYSKSQRHFDSVGDSTLSDLLSYLADGEFMIYLQPQVILSDSSLYGAEALIRRFDKKNQKMVFPDQFIPLYEQKSVIRHVDIFVVESVCKLLEQWDKEGKAIPISVNLSRVTLQEYGIVGTITEICDKYHVPHHLLVIEVTERVGLIENNVASSLIQEFKDNGFHISLDDFGCAYSNIVTLAQIEVDEVKIDKSLVDFIMTSKKNRVLVKNVLSMCNELDGASTLAEGIEDEEQAKMLEKLGCRLGQGYFYSRPIPVGEFCEKYIERMEERK